MPEQQDKPVSETSARTETVGDFAGLRRIMDKASRHPALSIAAVVGAGLIAGPEIAFSVLVGAAVGALLSRGGSRAEPVTKRMPEVRQRARDVFAAVRGKAHGNGATH
jgi:hypothetical protein